MVLTRMWRTPLAPLACSGTQSALVITKAGEFLCPPSEPLNLHCKLLTGLVLSPIIIAIREREKLFFLLQLSFLLGMTSQHLPE